MNRPRRSARPASAALFRCVDDPIRANSAHNRPPRASTDIDLLHGGLRLADVRKQVDDSEVYAERDTYAETATAGYAAEHAEIFEPVLEAHGLLLEISGLIALHIGAYG